MKLLGNTKSKITKNKNGKNVPNLEITEVVLINCNIAPNMCFVFYFSLKLLITPLVPY